MDVRIVPTFCLVIYYKHLCGICFEFSWEWSGIAELYGNSLSDFFEELPNCFPEGL